VGNKVLEVIGDRELTLFPGIDRGGAFPGFVYNSEKGARAAELQVNKSVLSAGSVPNVFRSYYNGGGVFVDAAQYRDQGVEILASYTEKLAVDPGDSSAAIVYCKVGDGAALLTGPHPEFVFLGKPVDNWSLTKPRFAAANLEKKEEVPGFDQLVETLAEDEKHRMDFMKACLTKLGLSVTEEQNVPSLSTIHLSSLQASRAHRLVESWREIIATEEGEEYIKDDNDKFHIINPSAWSLGKLYHALPSALKKEDKTDEESGSGEDRIVDYNTITKEIVVHDNDHPAFDETPYFNHDSFYSSLSGYQMRSPEAKSQFGNHLLYGEVVTSTNTLLEKNTKLLRRLLTGLTAIATSQLAGRGRGSNVWVSPPGSLMFSTVICHPMKLMQKAPVVFVQYLAALAVVEGVKSYDGNLYKDMPVKLKWPNDIYALDPSKATTPNASTTDNNVQSDRDNYVKIGGILVNSHYNAQDYIAVCGIGLNLSNNLPTTSLNALLPLLNHQAKTTPPTPFTPEKLLASILVSFDTLYTRFLHTGFDDVFLQKYYSHWLHDDQVITLEAEDGMPRARIKGITSDYGLLIAEELEDDSAGRWRGTGRMWRLQSDSNSFDFFKGLVKRKM
jgi:biotin---protein ligase